MLPPTFCKGGMGDFVSRHTCSISPGPPLSKGGIKARPWPTRTLVSTLMVRNAIWWTRSLRRILPHCKQWRCRRRCIFVCHAWRNLPSLSRSPPKFSALRLTALGVRDGQHRERCRADALLIGVKLPCTRELSLPTRVPRRCPPSVTWQRSAGEGRPRGHERAPAQAPAQGAQSQAGWGAWGARKHPDAPEDSSHGV